MEVLLNNTSSLAYNEGKKQNAQEVNPSSSIGVFSINALPGGARIIHYLKRNKKESGILHQTPLGASWSAYSNKLPEHTEYISITGDP